MNLQNGQSDMHRDKLLSRLVASEADAEKFRRQILEQKQVIASLIASGSDVTEGEQHLLALEHSQDDCLAEIESIKVSLRT